MASSSRVLSATSVEQTKVALRRNRFGLKSSVCDKSSDIFRVSTTMPGAGRLKLEPMDAQIRSCSLSSDDYPICIFVRSVQCAVNHGGLAECDRGIEL